MGMSQTGTAFVLGEYQDGVGTAPIWGLRLINCLGEYATNDGFFICGSQCYVSNCFAANNHGSGFRVMGSSDILMNNNNSRGSDSNGIYFDCSRGYLIGNTIFSWNMDKVTPTSNRGACAIQAVGADRVSITNNIMQNATAAQDLLDVGVYLPPSGYYTTSIGNIFYGSSGHRINNAFYQSAASANSIIEGNSLNSYVQHLGTTALYNSAKIIRNNSNTDGTRLRIYNSTIQIDSLTANTALYADANKRISSSTATAIELAYLSGVSSAIQDQFSGKLGIHAKADSSIKSDTAKNLKTNLGSNHIAFIKSIDSTLDTTGIHYNPGSYYTYFPAYVLFDTNVAISGMVQEGSAKSMIISSGGFANADSGPWIAFFGQNHANTGNLHISTGNTGEYNLFTGSGFNLRWDGDIETEDDFVIKPRPGGGTFLGDNDINGRLWIFGSGTAGTYGLELMNDSIAVHGKLIFGDDPTAWIYYDNEDSNLVFNSRLVGSGDFNFLGGSLKDTSDSILYILSNIELGNGRGKFGDFSIQKSINKSLPYPFNSFTNFVFTGRIDGEAEGDILFYNGPDTTLMLKIAGNDSVVIYQPLKVRDSVIIDGMLKLKDDVDCDGTISALNLSAAVTTITQILSLDERVDFSAFVTTAGSNDSGIMIVTNRTYSYEVTYQDFRLHVTGRQGNEGNYGTSGPPSDIDFTISGVIPSSSSGDPIYTSGKTIGFFDSVWVFKKQGYLAFYILKPRSTIGYNYYNLMFDLSVGGYGYNANRCKDTTIANAVIDDSVATLVVCSPYGYLKDSSFAAYCSLYDNLTYRSRVLAYFLVKYSDSTIQVTIPALQDVVNEGAVYIRNPNIKDAKYSSPGPCLPVCMRENTVGFGYLIPASGYFLVKDGENTDLDDTPGGPFGCDVKYRF
jgi:hypothetical protein